MTTNDHKRKSSLLYIYGCTHNGNSSQEFEVTFYCEKRAIEHGNCFLHCIVKWDLPNESPDKSSCGHSR